MNVTIHTLNDAVDGTEEAYVVGKCLRLISYVVQDVPDNIVLILHQLLAVEVLIREEEKSFIFWHLFFWCW